MEFTNNHTQDSKLWTDLVFRRKFRPLVPKPICSSKLHTPYSSTLSNPCYCYICQNPNIPSWNNHPLLSDLMSSDYGSNNKKFINNMPLVSTRWNPTPEQLESLEEMYKRGIRTPTAEQIQQIAAKLKRFGKIEGKNVFYWFQNHKARERQKKRRQLELLASGKKKMNRSDHHQTDETKPRGFSKSQMEIDYPKKLSVPSNYSSTLPTYHQGSECKKDGWSGLDQNQMELQQVIAKNESCSWNLELSSWNDRVQVVNAQSGRENGNVQPSRVEDDQTLELFPVKSCRDLDDGAGRDVSVIENKFRPNEFIEFLPMRD